MLYFYLLRAQVILHETATVVSAAARNDTSLEVAGDDIEVERRMVGYDLEAFLFCMAEEARSTPYEQDMLHAR